MTTPTAPHILEAFDKALDDCRQMVITMGSITRQNLQSALSGLMDRCDEACNQAIADDYEVNQLDKRIDSAAHELLMRFQPLAHDFREVIAAAKISNNLERVSDQAANVAKRARKVNKLPEFAEIKMVEPVFTTAMRMLDDSITCYTDRNLELAMDIVSRDKELDKSHKKLIKQYTSLMEEDSSLIKPLLHLIFIVRFLERIGDHCVNIAEDVMFVLTAKDLRYMGRKQVREELDQSGVLGATPGS